MTIVDVVVAEVVVVVVSESVEETKDVVKIARERRNNLKNIFFFLKILEIVVCVKKALSEFLISRKDV